MRITIFYFFYILLPLRFTKRFWSSEFEEFINRLNKEHNDTGRNTYNPQQYSSGENFESNNNRLKHIKGSQLAEFLDKSCPKHIVEVGPGSGFFTRQLIECPSVESYTSIEVNKSFTQYLENMTKKYDLETHFINEDYKSIALNELRCDCIVAIECLHHMHDRTDFLKKALNQIPNLRCMYFHDPVHYLPRLLRLLRKTPMYLRSRSAYQDSSWSTHHFMTIGEFEMLRSQYPQLNIEYQPVIGPRLGAIAKVFTAVENLWPTTRRTYPLSRYFMTSIGVTVSID